MIEMLHHPYCTKSIAALDFVTSTGVEVKITDLTKFKLTAEFLIELCKRLDTRPQDLIRTNEKIFVQNFEGKSLSDMEWIDVLIKHPILLQRPIFIDDSKAVIGRPPEKIFELPSTKKG
ncbi:MAG: arsenate reductase (glutaredoxin) [Crocinitomicaceae bacterium]|nr:arsenate reductase (glutaredoxin) [Crocinitomicaceae bacterium]